jgi:hypothetical protein
MNIRFKPFICNRFTEKKGCTFFLRTGGAGPTTGYNISNMENKSYVQRKR